MAPTQLRRRPFPAGVGPLRGSALAALALAVAAGGCSPLLLRSQSPDAEDVLAVQPTSNQDKKPKKYLAELTAVGGVTGLKVESVGLVTRLSGTGSDPPPTALRERLIAEMQTHEVHQPHRVLASPDTSLVLVRAYLPPGVQKGDRVDVEVYLPPRSETTSLRGGWLMKSRLRPLPVLGGVVQDGHVSGWAEGPLLVDAIFSQEGEQDPEAERRAWILGGAESGISRPLGLALVRGHQTAHMAAAVAHAINQRFYRRDGSRKAGVATAKNDRYVELLPAPLYRHNLARYVQVVARLVVAETPTEHAARLQMLEGQLSDPATAELAALELEAVGSEAVPLLQAGLQHADGRVSFYAAEALAYLESKAADHKAAVARLSAAARDEPAFRGRALAALAVMDEIEPLVALTELLHAPSVETRYGAFRALKIRNPQDELVRGASPDGLFWLHETKSEAAPLIHFARWRRAEAVIFGEPRLENPQFCVFAGGFNLKPVGPDRVRISRFVAGQEDRSAECSTRVADVIHTIAQLGGGYGDVLEGIRTLKEGDALPATLAIDAAPRVHRPPPTEALAGGADPAGAGAEAAPAATAPTDPSAAAAEALATPGLFRAGHDTDAARPFAETEPPPLVGPDEAGAEAADAAPSARSGWLGRMLFPWR